MLGLFALLKGSVIFVFFRFLQESMPLFLWRRETLETSLLYEPVKKIVPTIFPTVLRIEKKMNLKRLKQDHHNYFY